MSAHPETLVAYIDEQLRAILAAPRMWGSDESVELQILQLLEFRSVTLRPEVEKREPRTVLNAYHQFLKEAFPGTPPHPLFHLVRDGHREGEFIPLLKRFSEGLCLQMQAEDLFANHDLVLRLWLHESVSVPRASSLTSYYEILHRVLRAVSRNKGKSGRASKALEEAIDFEMPEVLITPANGKPAHVVMALDQKQTSESESVRRGLQRLVDVNEWAGESSQDSVELLRQRLPDKEDPARLAALAMDLIPSNLLQMVELGGRLITNAHPLKIKPHYAERLFTVVKQSRRPRDFEEAGVIRAVDGDQRSMRIKVGERSYKCFFQSSSDFEKYREVLTVGGSAKVSGQLYTTGIRTSSSRSGVVEVEKLFV